MSVVIWCVFIVILNSGGGTWWSTDRIGMGILYEFREVRDPPEPKGRESEILQRIGRLQGDRAMSMKPLKTGEV